jgi:hypothetical protein
VEMGGKGKQWQSVERFCMQRRSTCICAALVVVALFFYFNFEIAFINNTTLRRGMRKGRMGSELILHVQVTWLVLQQ